LRALRGRKKVREEGRKKKEIKERQWKTSSPTALRSREFEMNPFKQDSILRPALTLPNGISPYQDRSEI
jgi:hypothetical protein